jgi:hypothetical protein
MPQGAVVVMSFILRDVPQGVLASVARGVKEGRARA